MSQQYLRNLTEQEYLELMQLLYEKQEGLCYICNEPINASITEANVIVLKNRRVFHIEDYALCHKTCDIYETRKAVFVESIVNNIETISFEVETPEGVELPTSLSDNDLTREGEYHSEDPEWEELKKIERLKRDAMYYFFDGREYKAKNDFSNAIISLEKAVAILHPLKPLHERDVYPEVYGSLIDCYRKNKDRDNEIRVLKLVIEKYNSPKFTKMLNKVMGIKSDYTLSKESYVFANAENLGERYDNHVRNHLPEFNFYINNFNPFIHYNFEKKGMLPVIREIDGHFYELFSRAQKAEDTNDYDEAVALYEQAIAERCYIHKPYDRLIVLYTKAKRREDVIRVLEKGISFFEERKSSQIEYIRKLATKYNAEKYVEMCIKTGKQIRYFCGYIVLFDDYPFINKWKEKLNKMM